MEIVEVKRIFGNIRVDYLVYFVYRDWLDALVHKVNFRIQALQSGTDGGIGYGMV
jgi:hypothetical protein